jgi:Protein of unknown function VcgC/VcgE (DUF2780)
MELVNQLTQQLGINQQQASGGLGLIMGMAKQKLGGDFGSLAQHVPGVDNLINSAPKPTGAASGVGGGIGGALGSLGGMLGGKAGGALGQLGNLSALAGGFKQLGLDAGMIGKFAPIVLNFFQSKGGDAAKGLIERVLK